MFSPKTAPPIFTRRHGTFIAPRPLYQRLSPSKRHFRFRVPLLALGILALLALGVQYLSRIIGDAPMLSEPEIALPADSSTFHHAALTTPSWGTVSHRIRKGESINSIVSHYGFNKELVTEIDQGISMLQPDEKAKPVLAPGNEIIFILDFQGIVNHLEFYSVRVPRLKLTRNNVGKFVATVIEKPRERREHVIMGAIERSFGEAAAAAGLSYGVVDEIVDLFSDRVLFREDFRRGDRFTVIYDGSITTDDSRLGDGTILASALTIKGQRLAAIRYVGADGKARYFNEKGEPLGGSFLRYPVKFSKISSSFSKARFHPILQRFRPHNGVDFAAPVGTAVRAVGHGRIAFAGRNGGNGIMVKIKHSDRYSTAYLHLSKLAPGIKRGAIVERGQIIGAVGATGLATGPHLHFSLFDRGKYVDPMTAALPVIDLLDRRMKIGEKYLQRALFTLDHYQGVEPSPDSL